MPEPDDHQLLAAFARAESELAFAVLVERYVNLVYSTAVRSTGNPHHAEEITQAVFVILARKAGKLSPRVVLSGWLYQAARLTSANLVKVECRRRRREQEAYMQSALNEPTNAAWREIAPLLDEAMGRLSQTDRDAVVLRFFENKSAAEIGAALQMNEETARRRVNRALEKLRKFFAKRGVSSTMTGISGMLSTKAVHAAPAALAKNATTMALAKGAAASASTLTLIKGAMKIMAWTKVKTAIVFSVGILLAAGTTTILVENLKSPRLTLTLLGIENNPQSHPPKGEGVFRNAKGLCAIFRVTNVGKTRVWFDTSALEQKIGSKWLRTPVPPYPSRTEVWAKGIRPMYLISSDDLNNRYPPGASWNYVVEWPPDIPTNATWRLELRYARAPSTLVGGVGTAIESNLFAGRRDAIIYTPPVTQ